MADQGEPKIIIDSDWKSQAQKEKERLAAKEKESAKARPEGSGEAAGLGGSGGAGGEGAMPPADFTTLVGTLVTQALLYMGGFPDPQTGRALVSLEHARLHIDLLAVLEEKTKGNLSQEETADLSQALNELRLRFVEISRAIAAMAAKRAEGGGGGGMPDLRSGGAGV